MASKLAAARIASWSGVRAVIANASRPNVLADSLAAVPGFGTTFAPTTVACPPASSGSPSPAAPTAPSPSTTALAGRSSSGASPCCPRACVGVAGDFDAGDPVDVATPDGLVFARGIAAVDTATLRAVAGRRTGDLPPEVPHEVIHRDDLVVLPS